MRSLSFAHVKQTPVIERMAKLHTVIGESKMSVITWPYVLRAGHSADPAQGACAMDAINWLVHGRHGDAPECACPVIAAYVIHGNDFMPDDVRQRLLPYLHRIAGSRSAAHEANRAKIMWLAAVRIFAPRVLDAVGLHDHANKLRNLPDDITAKAAETAAKAAETAAREAETAARATETAARAREAAEAAARAAEAAEGAAEAAEAAARATKTAAWAAAWGVVVAARAADAAAQAAADAGAWDDYFSVLDQVLNAGPQGDVWSADALTAGTTLFADAGGVAEVVQ